MYKLRYFQNPESHAHGTVVGVIDDDGKVIDRFFDDQEDAFDYIKTELENDTYYKAFISNPDIYIKEIYDELDVYDKTMIQKNLIVRYRRQCMDEYFK